MTDPIQTDPTVDPPIRCMDDLCNFGDTVGTVAGGKASIPPAKKQKRDHLVQYWAFRFTGSKIHNGGEGLNKYMKVEWIKEFGFQLEEGNKNCKVHHFQGSFEVDPRKRFDQVAEYFIDLYSLLIFDGRDYLQPCKSKAAERYGMKEDTRKDGPWYHGPRFEQLAKELVYKVEIDLRPWQVRIRMILDGDPNDRTVWWFWEPYGGLGKTTFLKWIYQNYPDVIVLSGKAADMKNGVVEYKESQKKLPKIVLINIPKTTDLQYVSMTGLEEVKDMFFFSPKYHGGMICGRPPIEIIFANSTPPCYDGMAKDRWKIIRLPDGKAKDVDEVHTEDWTDLG